MKDFLTFNLSIPTAFFSSLGKWLMNHMPLVLFNILTLISLISFLVYLDNGLGLAYNDARSHLDIGRRVVEGLKPGMAQLGSVWLPLPHLLMVPTIWNDTMWHTGLSGAIQSMISFVAVGLFIYLFLKQLGVSMLGRLTGVAVFAANLNVLYMQSTAMTELLLMATMTAAVYELVLWTKKESPLYLVRSSFWIMLATLIRYDGWFLLAYSVGLLGLILIKRRGYKATEGTLVFFCTLGGLGIALWFLWNLLIFKDPLYFAFGPYSARAQQEQIESAGLLASKGDLFNSMKVYFYALAYNTGLFTLIAGFVGAFLLWTDKTIKLTTRLITSALFAPLLFNVIALFFGHSVLFIQGLSGDTWFNVRYGLMMAPSTAIFVGYLISRTKKLGIILVALLLLVTLVAIENRDAVTIDDARVGSSQKNVTEVSGWLERNAKNQDGFILISAASHDAIIFSSNLPMARYIHEGTGKYWESATTNPERWARWIIMRSYDDGDSTWKAVSKTPDLNNYSLVEKYPFADIYELKPEFLSNLNTKPVLGEQK